MLKRQTFVSVPFGFAQGTHSLRVRIHSGYAFVQGTPVSDGKYVPFGFAQGTHWLRVRIRVGYAFAQGMPVSDG